MPARTVDFRSTAFNIGRVDASGKYVGRESYWRIYAIENLVRALVHSVLSIQIAANWWAIAVDPNIQARVRRFRNDYALQPWHTSPGAHNLYYTQLPDLMTIIRQNSNLFLPIVPDIDAWVGRLDQIRLPRNIVGHMNWPNVADRRRIEAFHADFQALVRQVAASGLTIVIP